MNRKSKYTQKRYKEWKSWREDRSKNKEIPNKDGGKEQNCLANSPYSPGTSY